MNREIASVLYTDADHQGSKRRRDQPARAERSTERSTQICIGMPACGSQEEGRSPEGHGEINREIASDLYKDSLF